MGMVVPAYLPSPDVSQIPILPSTIHIGPLALGPIGIHLYAVCIMVGIAAAAWLTMRRWRARQQDPDVLWDIIFWAVIAGVIGARAYHVIITDPVSYFGPGANPVDALKIWEGGVGIMGALTFGAVAAWWVSRKNGLSLSIFADAVAPGLLLAQAIGRWGNWFNQELFGGPTTLPWGLRIDPLSANFPAGLPADTLFHPTFLYESLWNLTGVVILLAVDRKFHLTHGRLFGLYLVYYGVGRLLIELFLRIDPALMVLGVRVHVWTALGLILLGTAVYVARSRSAARGVPERGAEPEIPAEVHGASTSRTTSIP